MLFTAISLGSARAVASRASSADGTPLAAGCVEVPGSVLRADQVLSLSLDLRDLLPRIKGSYQLTTEVRLPTGKVGSLSWPRPLADALTPWGDLSDCKWDPAQALLDCLVDALDVSDPLDCLVDKPSAKALSIQNERGVVSSGCRTGLTQRGTTSLEKQLHSRMELQDKSLLVSLAKVEADALTMLGDLKLLSTLELSTLDSDGAAVARHELKAVALGKSASQVSFKADEIGLTSLAAHPIKATVKSWQLSLAQHALSLSFGILARAALSDGILGPAKLPKKSAKLAGKLANLVQVSVSGKTLSGCSAIEELVCKAARLGAGCLGKACAEGLTAMAARLDHGFTQIDQHKAADLVLSGEVALTDNNKDLRADILGSSTAPGLWKMKLQLSNEQVSPAEAEFTGKR